jgi:hypothetical protein
MFIDDKPDVERIERKLLAAIEFGSDDFEDLLTAVVRVFTFHMSLGCPDCRKNIARKLRKAVPEMLADANRLATTSPRAEHKHIH